jgi:hypothetical protein
MTVDEISQQITSMVVASFVLEGETIPEELRHELFTQTLKDLNKDDS